MTHTGPTYTCHHCGDVCSTLSLKKDDHRFCCSGCLSVYEILSQHGACDYYAIAGGGGNRPVIEEHASFDVLDRSPDKSHLVEYEDENTLRLRLKLPSMHCASCVWLLERLHRFDEGIVSSRVDLMRQTLRVECVKSQTSLSRVIKLLASLGYEPELHFSSSNSTDNQSSSLRMLYIRLGVAGFAAGNVMMIGLANYVAGKDGFDPVVKLVFNIISIGLSLPVLVFSAQPWLRSAWTSLRRGIISLDVPVSLGILTIFVRSCVDISTGSSEGFLDSFNGLVFFLLIGKLFQQRAFASIEFDRTMRSFFPMSATTLQRGHEMHVPIDELQPQDIIIVRNGEVIPADGVLLHESGVVDYAYITGESEPVECTPGRILFAGGRVLGRSQTHSVVKPSSSSYMASLWSRNDVHTDRDSYTTLSDRFGTIFTMSTIAVAVIGGLFWLPDAHMALTVFSSVLIIACPCALTLATPITLGSLMGRLGSVGIYLRNITIISELQRIRAIVFDKTGTITSPEQIEYHGQPLAETFGPVISALAAQSTHPISKVIARAIPFSTAEVYEVEEIAGVGIVGTVNGYRIALQAKAKGASAQPHARTYVTVDDQEVGYFIIKHAMRRGTAQMLTELRRDYRVRLVTGDGREACEGLKEYFGDANILSQATPHQKVEAIQALQQQGNRVLMVGDGLNDMAALSTANVSVAVSNDTSNLVPACDIVIPSNKISVLPSLLRASGGAKTIVAIALWFTMVYNALGLTLSCMGLLTPVITAIMMPVSSILVIGISVIGSRIMFRRLSWV